MNSRSEIAAPWAVLVGAFLLIEGIWGLFSPVVFGSLATNHTHAVIHIVLGFVGLATGVFAGAAVYSGFLGVLLLVVGVMRFIPGLQELVVSLLNVNFAAAGVNIVVGAVSLAIAFTARRERLM